MFSLHELQTRFREAIASGNPDPLAGLVRADGIDPARRVQIYRNNTFISLTEALAATYPVVCRLVDRRFFDFAATGYIAKNLPDRPCLFEYGGSFGNFLAAFPPAAELPYLPDVARLEWALNQVRNAPLREPLAPQALNAAAQSHGAALVLHFDPALRYVASDWAVDAIWRANQSAAEATEAASFKQQVWLEIRGTPAGIACRRIDPAIWQLRSRLQRGDTLAEAGHAVLAETPEFDLMPALHALAAERLLVGLSPN